MPDNLTRSPVMDARMGVIDVAAFLPAPPARTPRVDEATEGLIIIGREMAALLHGFSDSAWTITPPDRAAMRDLCRQWDAAQAALREAQRP